MGKFTLKKGGKKCISKKVPKKQCVKTKRYKKKRRRTRIKRGGAAMMMPETVKAPWKRYYDPESNRFYYYNIDTKLTQWNPPDNIRFMTNWNSLALPQRGIVQHRNNIQILENKLIETLQMMENEHSMQIERVKKDFRDRIQQLENELQPTQGSIVLTGAERLGVDLGGPTLQPPLLPEHGYTRDSLDQFRNISMVLKRKQVPADVSRELTTILSELLVPGAPRKSPRRDLDSPTVTRLTNEGWVRQTI